MTVQRKLQPAKPLTIDTDRDVLGERTYPHRPFPREMVSLTLPIALPTVGYIVLPSEMTADEWDLIVRTLDAMRPSLVGEWPSAVSDGLTLPCADCGEVPRFDYRVTAEFWQRWVSGPERLGVVCLPCLDRRSGGAGLADALIEVQWTGTGHTVVSRPILRQQYEVRLSRRPGVDELPRDGR